MWPTMLVAAEGSIVPMRTVRKTTASDGNAVTLPQKAAHAVGINAFSSPAQPSHLPDAGIFGISAAAVMLIFGVVFELKSETPIPCVTSPMARTKASITVAIRRTFVSIDSKYQ